MKKILIVNILILLTACGQIPVKKEADIPSLSTVAPLVKEEMTMPQVAKVLSGHKPTLKFSHHNNTICEIRERKTDPETRAMTVRNLTVSFNGNGKVAKTHSTFCTLPDQQPKNASNPETTCYQKHVFPFEKQLTYDAIKRLLIISNYQIEHSDAGSELISGTGSQNLEGDDDKMMFIKLTMAFSETNDNGTEVIMSATFNISEKQSKWVQAGFAGVTLPVPLPFQKTEEWIGTGLVTPKFYLSFYDALTNLIAHEYLPYSPVLAKVAETKNEVKTVQVLPQPATPYVNAVFSSADRLSNDEELADDEKEDELEGEDLDALLLQTGKPIDAVLKVKKNFKTAERSQSVLIETKTNENIFAELNGKPIDSWNIKRR